MIASRKFIAALEAYDAGDMPRALKLMRESAVDGYARACYFMALWARDAEFGPNDDATSSYWFNRLERLAEDGDPAAQWELGQSLRFGDLGMVDLAAANKWLERSASNGWPDAQHHLAAYLEAGQFGFTRDIAAAEGWYKRALEQNYPETLYTFAMREVRGGVPSTRALELLRQAADLGFKPADEALQKYLH